MLENFLLQKSVKFIINNKQQQATSHKPETTKALFTSNVGNFKIVPKLSFRLPMFPTNISQWRWLREGTSSRSVGCTHLMVLGDSLWLLEKSQRFGAEFYFQNSRTRTKAGGLWKLQLCLQPENRGFFSGVEKLNFCIWRRKETSIERLVFVHTGT